MRKEKDLFLQNIDGAASAAELNALTIGVVIQIDHIAAHTGILGSTQTIYNAIIGYDIHLGSQWDNIFIDCDHSAFYSGAGGGSVAYAAMTAGVSGCSHIFGAGKIQCCAGSKHQSAAAVIIFSSFFAWFTLTQNTIPCLQKPSLG